MKLVFLAIFTACFTFLGIAQNENQPKAGDQIITDDKGIEYSWDEWKNRKNKHWQGLDFGINYLQFSDQSNNPPKGFSYLEIDPARSFYIGLNLAEKDFTIVGEYVKIVTGIGFDWYSFQFTKDVVLSSVKDTLIGTIDPINNFSKNRLKSGHITVPILLAFNTNVKHSKSFHIAMGVILSYRLSGKQKIVFENNGVQSKISRKAVMHQNPGKAAATLRLGYNNFHLFGNYALTSFWEKGAAPEARTVVVGLKILPW